MFSASKSKGASSGYQIANSLRFRSSASAYLSRVITLSATWTLSLWVKRGKLSVTSPIFGSSIGFNSNDTLTAGTLTTTAVYRDPSAWYHIVVSNNGCYVNGVSVGSVTTGILVNPSIGNYLTNYFDGYLADIYLIDGLSLSATSFGQFNSITGVWGPKQYAGSYGSVGFHLNFSNGTSTTTLGYDVSGNGNNWTTNNISLTSGSTYDWMLDSPTPFAGSSYGVGNYAVLVPFTVCNAQSAGWGTSSASDGNLNYSSTGAVSNSWSSFALPSSGKYYAEFRFSSLTSAIAGVLSYNGNANRSVLFYQTGQIYNNNAVSQTLTAWSSGDTIGFAINMDASTIQFYRNGSAVGSAESITVAYGQYFLFARYQAYLEANFGQRPFAYTPPSGYKSLCTYNLPTPTIQNGANYMAATTYTGTGATQTLSNAVNSVSFAPGLVWAKLRSGADNHRLADTVRGANKLLMSNLTDAESSLSTVITAFTSSGFTVGTDGSVNTSGQTYVGWQWKAGGTAVTNTAGSITSSVSANTTSGFAVVTWTANGSAATIGHGLGVAPSMVILKSRSPGGYAWAVWHTSIPITNILELSGTAASANYGTAFWNSTLPTSTVFSTGVNGNTSNGNTLVAYCFAAIPGYSAFGSYTGNGSTDGPFVYCGFRPRFILQKRTDSTSDWRIHDTSRAPYNADSIALMPNLANAEDTGSNVIDVNSNGFKCRDAGAFNVNAATYIYAAFAENPFKYSLAR